MKRLIPVIAAAVITGGIAAPAQAASTPKPVRYSSCTALAKVYKHGVARPGGRDLIGGKVKKNSAKGFRVDAKLYKLNAHLDRDHDGVACER